MATHIFRVAFLEDGSQRWEEWNTTTTTTTTTLYDPKCVTDIIGLIKYWVDPFASGGKVEFGVQPHPCPPGVWTVLTGPFFPILMTTVCVVGLIIFTIRNFVKDLEANSKVIVKGVKVQVLLRATKTLVNKFRLPPPDLPLPLNAVPTPLGPPSLLNSHSTPSGPSSPLNSHSTPPGLAESFSIKPLPNRVVLPEALAVSAGGFSVSELSPVSETPDEPKLSPVSETPDDEPKLVLTKLGNLEKLKELLKNMQKDNKEKDETLGLGIVVAKMEGDVMTKLRATADRDRARTLRDSGIIGVLQEMQACGRGAMLLHHKEEKKFFEQVQMPVLPGHLKMDKIRSKVMSWVRKVALDKGEKTEKIEYSRCGNCFMGVTVFLLAGCIDSVLEFAPTPVQGVVTFIVGMHCLGDALRKLFRKCMLRCCFKKTNGKDFFEDPEVESKERLTRLVRGRVAMGKWYRCGQCTGHGVPDDVINLLDDVLKLRKELNDEEEIPGDEHADLKIALRALLTDDMIELFLEDYYSILLKQNQFFDDMWRPLVFALDAPDLLQKDRYFCALTGCCGTVASEGKCKESNNYVDQIKEKEDKEQIIYDHSNDCKCCCNWYCGPVRRSRYSNLNTSSSPNV